jgi:SAM-dependent methyltransferase
VSEISNVGPFESSAGEYDRWYDDHPEILAGEVAALQECLGASAERSLEIGVGTGRFAAALGTRFGLDPSAAMLAIAAQRNIMVCRGVGERLPFASGCFDAVLLVTVLCFVIDRQAVLLEAGRVLREGGKLVVGFIDRASPLGRRYQARKDDSRYYRQATFLTAEEIETLLRRTGFEPTCWRQTLFESEAGATRVREGRGEGGFVAVSARKA